MKSDKHLKKSSIAKMNYEGLIDNSFFDYSDCFFNCDIDYSRKDLFFDIDFMNAFFFGLLTFRFSICECRMWFRDATFNSLTVLKLQTILSRKML